MRKVIVLAGLLLAAALFSGAPAQAAPGCLCVKWNAPGVCMPSVDACVKDGGVCILPCDYQAPKKAVHKAKKHKAAAKKPAAKKPAAKKDGKKKM